MEWIKWIMFGFCSNHKNPKILNVIFSKMSETCSEEDSGDFGLKPRKATEIPEPEPDNVSFQSVSSVFSQNHEENGTQELDTHVLIQSLKSIPVNSVRRKEIGYNPELIQQALETDNVQELLKEATKMITALSCQFSSIMQQIDCNEEKIAHLEQVYLQQKQRR